jgi:hypothetical protein
VAAAAYLLKGQHLVRLAFLRSAVELAGVASALAALVAQEVVVVLARCLLLLAALELVDRETLEVREALRPTPPVDAAAGVAVLVKSAVVVPRAREAQPEPGQHGMGQLTPLAALVDITQIKAQTFLERKTQATEATPTRAPAARVS